VQKFENELPVLQRQTSNVKRFIFPMRYFIRLSFSGKKFHGWQIQKNANSVQAELNNALSTLLRNKDIETTGCGRTDTGVHARKFFAHLDTDEIKNPSDLIHQLNSILPHEIAIQALFPVDEKSHARFSAQSRTYVYRTYRNKNPFLKDWSYFYPHNPSVSKMNSFAAILKDHNDFSSFSKSNTQTLTNKCMITFAEWKPEGDELVFTITADRFLRNMVRAIVGTLLDAGTTDMNEKEFNKILLSRSRSDAGVSVPAHGLYLTDIQYPFSVF
jgi:tRNA pseudouridine38-40 synthase